MASESNNGGGGGGGEREPFLANNDKSGNDSGRSRSEEVPPLDRVGAAGSSSGSPRGDGRSEVGNGAGMSGFGDGATTVRVLDAAEQGFPGAQLLEYVFCYIAIV